MTNATLSSDSNRAGRALGYRMLPAAPPLAPHELESQARAIEIVILWGSGSVLHVEHLSPPRSFFVGDAGAGTDIDTPAIDFLIGEASLGRAFLPIVIEEDGESFVLVHESASVKVWPHAAEGACLERDELRASGDLQPTAADTTLERLRLSDDRRVELQHGEFTFLVTQMQAAERIGTGLQPLAIERQGWTLASFALHAALVMLFYFAPPMSSALSIDRISPDSRWVKFAELPPEVQLDPFPSDTRDEPHDAASASGAAAPGPSGASGKPHAPRKPAPTQSDNCRDCEPAPLGQGSPPRDVANDSIIVFLRANAPSEQGSDSPYTGQRAAAYNADAGLAALLHSQLGESFGFGGMGIGGTGRGGGGRALGTIGVGAFGTRNGRGGSGNGGNGGYGSAGVGQLGPRTGGVMPRIRADVADVHGSLSKEVIRRVIGRHLAEVRYCYTQALLGKPDLQGRVAIKFAISPSGAVMKALVDSSTLSDAATEQCIASAVARWSFPAPEGGGLVVVTYPFMLQQVAQ